MPPPLTASFGRTSLPRVLPCAIGKDRVRVNDVGVELRSHSESGRAVLATQGLALWSVLALGFPLVSRFSCPERAGHYRFGEGILGACASANKGWKSPSILLTLYDNDQKAPAIFAFKVDSQERRRPRPVIRPTVD